MCGDCSVFFPDNNEEGLPCIWANTGNNNFYSEIIMLGNQNRHPSDNSMRDQTDSGGHFVTFIAVTWNAEICWQFLLLGLMTHYALSGFGVYPSDVVKLFLVRLSSLCVSMCLCPSLFWFIHDVIASLSSVPCFSYNLQWKIRSDLWCFQRQVNTCFRLSSFL